MYTVRRGAGNPASRNLTRTAARRGRVQGAQTNRTKAVEEYADVLPTITELREEGRSLREIAEALNADGVTTDRGIVVRRPGQTRTRSGCMMRLGSLVLGLTMIGVGIAILWALHFMP